MTAMLTVPEIDRSALRLLRRDRFPARAPVETRWSDNDEYGHLNNAVYSEIFDTALDSWLAGQVGGRPRHVLGAATTVFLRETSHPARLEVGIAIQDIGRTSARYLLALFDDDDDPLAVAAWTEVFVDPATRRAIPVPDVLRTLPRLDPEAR